MSGGNPGDDGRSVGGSVRARQAPDRHPEDVGLKAAPKWDFRAATRRAQLRDLDTDGAHDTAAAGGS